MAEIFDAPEGIEIPEFNFTNFNAKEHQEKEEKFIEEVKKRLIDHYGNKEKNVGELISFPVADGSAVYMVMTMNPVKLVHIPIGDAWEFQYVHLLTAKEVQEKIDQQKSISKLFS